MKSILQALGKMLSAMAMANAEDLKKLNRMLDERAQARAVKPGAEPAVARNVVLYPLHDTQ